MPAERRKCYPIRRTASRIDWWYIIFTPSTGQVADSFAFCIVFLLFCSPHCTLCMFTSLASFLETIFLCAATRLHKQLLRPPFQIIVAGNTKTPATS
ncbi:uncharacterized protein ASPGLDRAFT_1175992 [Aspergillus glaucus CBS 516.65]|uniref:Uncharacterized protein n=1 Tax=Aspergillus glaucus CBS 516.65 TaxID=1160497 RepID=A0A1L9VU75_ASPGL|nr:hypothetical protein ASPGLDRAFT_1175992 [Aspergillus glaucus CBS 516.65]OJJ87437.1 hypothetical protein ASPGLDRAFT_1175992 [Aspergillus glaucus CBS 516.65]